VDLELVSKIFHITSVNLILLLGALGFIIAVHPRMMVHRFQFFHYLEAMHRMDI
jgi:hypothetical protein